MKYNYVSFKEKKYCLSEVQISLGILYSYLLKLATLM